MIRPAQPKSTPAQRGPGRSQASQGKSEPATVAGAYADWGGPSSRVRRAWKGAGWTVSKGITRCKANGRPNDPRGSRDGRGLNTGRIEGRIDIDDENTRLDTGLDAGGSGFIDAAAAQDRPQNQARNHLDDARDGKDG